MRKKAIKSILSCVLCIAMITTPMTAFASELQDPVGQEATGSNGMVNPIFRIIVPTDLVFATDAFEQKHETNIYSSDYPIINKSNVAVNVDVALSVEGKDGVSFQTDEAKVTETDTSKKVWFAAAVPITTKVSEVLKDPAPIEIKETDDSISNIYTVVNADISANFKAATATAASGSAISFDPELFPSDSSDEFTSTIVNQTDVEKVENTVDFSQTLSDQAKTSTLSVKATTLSFALNKAEYTKYNVDEGADKFSEASIFDAMAADQAGSAVFRFVGTVNSNAAWAAEDITAKAVFTFSGKSDTNYNALLENLVEVGTGTTAHALVGVTAPVYVAPVISGEASKDGAGVASDVSFEFTMGDATDVISVTPDVGSALAEDDYTFADGTLTLKSATLSALTATTIYTVKFNDDTTIAVTVTKAKVAPVISDVSSKDGAGLSSDVSFAFTMNDATSVDSVTPEGGSALAVDAYSFDTDTLTLKAATLSALTATTVFTVKFDDDTTIDVTVTKAAEVIPTINGVSSKLGAGVNADVTFAFDKGDATGITLVTYVNSTSQVTTVTADKYTFAGSTLTLKTALVSILGADRTYTITFNNPSATTIAVTVTK